MTDEEYDEQEEQAERISAIKEILSLLINENPFLGSANPFELENDIFYSGPLAALLEFFQENRSELEELDQ